MLGGIFIGPAYPGRSSHVSQCVLVTHPHHRRKGVGLLMGRIALRAAAEKGHFFWVLSQMWRKVGGSGYCWLCPLNLLLIHLHMLSLTNTHTLVVLLFVCNHILSLPCRVRFGSSTPGLREQ